jgi:hypothetical protein
MACHSSEVSGMTLKGKQFGVEVQASGRGAGSPFVPHRSDSKGLDAYIELVRPFENVPFEIIFAAGALHGRKLF